MSGKDRAPKGMSGRIGTDTKAWKKGQILECVE